MFVDTDLLRSGAEFSHSAGSIVQQGADRFAAAQLPAIHFAEPAALGGFTYSVVEVDDDGKHPWLLPRVRS